MERVAIPHHTDEWVIDALAKRGLSLRSLKLLRHIADGTLLGAVTHGQLLDDGSHLDAGDLRELARKGWIAACTRQIAWGNRRQFDVHGISMDGRRRLFYAEEILIAAHAANKSTALKPERQQLALASATQSEFARWIGHICQSLVLLAALLAVGRLLS